jgi:ABC-type glycerol-3-phosphate transport system substrate-binding protein
MQLTSTQRLEVVRSKSKLGAAYQMMTPPTFDPDRPAPAVVHGWHVAVPKTSRNSDTAWKLIAHWTSPSIQEYQMRQAGYLPVRRSVTAGAESVDPSISWALNYAAEHPLRFEWPENPELLASTIARAVSEVLTDRAAPEEALARAQQSYNEQRNR